MLENNDPCGMGKSFGPYGLGIEQGVESRGFGERHWGEFSSGEKINIKTGKLKLRAQVIRID